MFGKEQYVDYMNYTFIVTERKDDFKYMESTCFLTKLMQNKDYQKQYSYLKTNYDKKNNVLNVEGFLGDKTYYINILAQNQLTGEIITYKPMTVITSSGFGSKIRPFVIVLLIILFILFICLAFYFYRKYRIEKSKISDFQIDKNSDRSLKSINSNIRQKKYNILNEDNKELNSE